MPKSIVTPRIPSPSKTFPVMVYVTASSRDEAEKISLALVEEKLAACVTLIPEVYSRYWWQGKIESGPECLLVMKTFSSHFKRLSARIHELHSYKVPEILAIPVVMGSPPYLSWMKDTLSFPVIPRGHRRGTHK